METPAKTKKKTPYAHLFRLSHWILGAGMICLILSGYGIDGVSTSPWSLLDRYPSFYPGMRMLVWHKIIGIVFAPAAVIALIHFLPKMAGLKLTNIRKMAAALVIGSGTLCVLTGIGLIYSNIPAAVYQSCRFLHSVCGLVIAPISLIVHVYLALFKYFPLLVPSFAPIRQARWMRIAWLGIGLLSSWLLFTRFFPYHSGLTELQAVKVARSVSDPKNIDSLPWDTARSLEVQLVNGVGFDSGVTHAELKALYNNAYVYMRIQWKDEVYNREYRPWIKTDSGWMHLNPGGSDECIYNEDKLAFVFPIGKDPEFRRYGCSVYCHNDQKNGHGRHWTFGNTLVDAWHWKSVRTDPLGMMDDKYWLGTGEISDANEARHGDPGPEEYASNTVTGISNPMMLPKTLDSIAMGALIQSKAEIYTKKAAERFPVGSEVPGAVVSEAGGDRADIRCSATYQSDTWTLRIMRKMDTGSKYDVIFKPGGKFDFAMAAFDHNASRHSYNHQVYRLYFVP